MSPMERRFKWESNDVHSFYLVPGLTSHYELLLSLGASPKPKQNVECNPFLSPISRSKVLTLHTYQYTPSSYIFRSSVSHALMLPLTATRENEKLWKQTIRSKSSRPCRADDFPVKVIMEMILVHVVFTAKVVINPNSAYLRMVRADPRLQGGYGGRS